MSPLTSRTLPSRQAEVSISGITENPQSSFSTRSPMTVRFRDSSPLPLSLSLRTLSSSVNPCSANSRVNPVLRVRTCRFFRKRTRTFFFLAIRAELQPLGGLLRGVSASPSTSGEPRRGVLRWGFCLFSSPDRLNNDSPKISSTGSSGGGGPTAPRSLGT